MPLQEGFWQRKGQASDCLVEIVPWRWLRDDCARKDPVRRRLKESRPLKEGGGEAPKPAAPQHHSSKTTASELIHVQLASYDGPQTSQRRACWDSLTREGGEDVLKSGSLLAFPKSSFANLQPTAAIYRRHEVAPQHHQLHAIVAQRTGALGIIILNNFYVSQG